MPMTRKDYTLIAECIRTFSHGKNPDSLATGKGVGIVVVTEQDVLEGLVEEFCVRLMADNPRFQADRFRMACLGYVEK